MDHVAIMKKSWGLIPKILSGEKTIESRWYKARYTPWNRIKKGDTVYFKNAGEPVTVKATVFKVLQFILKNDRHPESQLHLHSCHPEHFDQLSVNRVEESHRNYIYSTVKQVLKKYAKRDGLGVNDIPKFHKLFKDKKYCILVFLADPKKIKPLNIDKTGFGAMSAWITIDNINSIKIPKV